MSRRTRNLLRAFIPLLVLGVFSFAAFAREPADPTRPPAAATIAPKTDASPKRQPLDLSAVFFADDRRVAIINGQRLHEQEVIEGARILEIEPGSVRLVRNDAEFRVELLGRETTDRPQRENEVQPMPAALAPQTRTPNENETRRTPADWRPKVKSE